MACDFLLQSWAVYCKGRIAPGAMLQLDRFPASLLQQQVGCLIDPPPLPSPIPIFFVKCQELENSGWSDNCVFSPLTPHKTAVVKISIRSPYSTRDYLLHCPKRGRGALPECFGPFPPCIMLCTFWSFFTPKSSKVPKL